MVTQNGYSPRSRDPWYMKFQIFFSRLLFINALLLRRRYNMMAALRLKSDDDWIDAVNFF